MIYCLVIRLPKTQQIRVGRLGLLDFKKGYYFYIGSAPTMARVKRHLTDKKKLKWHIDYLLKKAKIIDVLFFKGCECKIAERFARRYGGIKGFGCSDCRCRSHLFYSKTNLLSS